MRFIKLLVPALFLVFAASIAAEASPSEQEAIDRYLKVAQKRHAHKLGWLSGNFTLNRINKNNDYNKFSVNETSNFASSAVAPLDQAYSFGIDGGIIFPSNMAWSFGAEYWLKQGQNESGSFTYTPRGGSPVSISNLNSEIKVFGFYTGIQYYVSGAPSVDYLNSSIAIRLGGNIGYYQASWDIWQGYNNLNLSTSTSNNQTNTFKGTAPGYSIGIGVDYPLSIFGLSTGFDFSYLYLNFKNIAWYNSIDQEIIATYDPNQNSRVNLGMSGFRGKIEIKKFFSW